MSGHKDVQQRIESIESLLGELQKIADPAVQSLSKQLVQSLMDLHGSGIEKMLEIVHKTGDGGQHAIDEMGRDSLVSGLLLLYGLHPLDLSTRVQHALEKTRPYLKSHGGNVDLVGISEAGAVTLRLQGSCHSCPSSAVTLQSTVEQAIYDAAPDVTEIVVEGAVEQHELASGFVPLVQVASANGSSHQARTTVAASPTEWEDVVGLESLTPGTMRKQEIRGEPMLFCQLDENFYAYGMTCPGCGQPLEGGHLENAILACPICRQRFDLIHAGRSLDVAPLHLEPIPLLHENGRARVAVISRSQRSAI